MGYHRENMVDDTTWEFPGKGFWIVHVLGSLFIFLLGMRFAARRAPLGPLLIFRVLNMLRERR